MQAPEWQSTAPLRPASNTQAGPSRAVDFDFSDISASGHARQHNGNVYNNSSYNYTIRKRKSDDTLRENGRNRALLTAAAEGQRPRVSYLLQLGAELDFSDHEGFTALHHACISGFEDVVKVLLEAGADVNAQCLDLGTPLCLASLRGRTNVVDLLINYRANVNKAGLWVGTPLHCASYAGALDVMKVLLDHGANMTSTCSIRWRYLHYGCAIGSSTACESLKRDPNLECEIWECHPFLLAIYQKHADVMDHFAGLGFSVDTLWRYFYTRYPVIEDFDSVEPSEQASDCTPLMCAAGLVKDLTILSKLVCTGASIDAQDSRGLTAIHYAVTAGNSGAVQKLLEAGVDVNFVDRWKWTPLHRAVQIGDLAIVKLLSEAGATLDAQNKKGTTQLHQAASKGHLSIAEYMLGKGADPSAQTPEGSTALHLAVKYNSNEIVSSLLAYGVDASVRDNAGKTAAEYVSKSDSVMRNLLKVNGCALENRGSA